MNVLKWYNFSHWLHNLKVPYIPRLITLLVRLIFGCYIPHTAKIGAGTILGYGGIGIVIHSRAIIGDNCLLNSGVTIGGTSKKMDVPILGNRVYVGTGAKILGDVKVGDNVVIGANAVITKDIPSNCLVVGIPGQIAKKNIDINDYV